MYIINCKPLLIVPSVVASTVYTPSVSQVINCDRSAIIGIQQNHQ